ncbi:MAG TPA: hypothetical protein VMS09_11640 [Paenibacillus sp.]|nr:hypothetical protein [Paenibacillus sp.]HUC92668.1 hypothetical protein [Paenibacillus sp.]
MSKRKGQSYDQRMQAMRAESNEAEKSMANTKPTYHDDKHEPNRPSTG